MGSSGGITDVTMRMQCRSSSYLRGGEHGERSEHGEQKRRVRGGARERGWE
jgi:hypothetical protein